MIIDKIISHELPSLVLNDKIETALQYLDDWKVSHLPVVDGPNLVGLLDENTLLGYDDEKVRIQELPLLEHRVNKEDHIFEVIKIISDFKLSTVPVVGEEGRYLGEISLSSVMGYLAEMDSVRSEGAVIVLEMNMVDYSLVEIARLVEENDAKILSATITNLEGSRLSEVSLKINKTAIRGIIQGFQRFDYKIKAFYDAPNYEDDMRRRYDELMRYLDI
ncbi:MAG: CBS domain-containing protein [Flavobacteriales bacterium]|nr:CBS domain-containing protein [Flavobacteriales bacterium]MDG1781772.1 CBS domain-containing protein [Flavobacteriales bacterium]MDG2246012.1 CBS domain-containing protein [Flavobacteriales bacterium]